MKKIGDVHMRDSDGWDQGVGSGGGKEQVSPEAISRINTTGLVIG